MGLLTCKNRLPILCWRGRKTLLYQSKSSCCGAVWSAILATAWILVTKMCTTQTVCSARATACLARWEPHAKFGALIRHVTVILKYMTLISHPTIGYRPPVRLLARMLQALSDP